MRVFTAFFATILVLSACDAGQSERSLQVELEKLQEQNSETPGFAVTLIVDGIVETAATGEADPTGAPMDASTPVRIASITKTFVAASILRLWEDERLNLDASISSLVSPETDRLLRADGYGTNDITVRHLLMHASGMADHVGDAYISRVFAEPTKVWAPIEQIEILVESTDPLGTPGAQFEYSDTGYVILGEIIRQVTNLPLHKAVRELLKLDQLQLPSLHWDEQENPRDSVPNRAHQWNDGFDISALHGSMDGHGGGGVVASVTDVAKFYDALFNGKVFSQPSTLELMTNAPGHPPQSPYRYGLYTFDIAGREAFHHGGFWGTYVSHVPSLNLTISGVALDKRGYKDLRGLMKQTTEDRAAE